MSLPCEPWTTEDRLCCPDEGPTGVCDDPPVTPTYPWTDAELIDVASRLLYHATCERFTGSCPASLRPCSCACPDCTCCSCSVHAIALAGRYPVLQVTEVVIDGVVLAPAAYRLDEFSRLVRVDGGRWPHWQDLHADPDVVGGSTFIIRYTVGRAVPVDLQYAAALLTCELKLACGGQGCRLPEGTQRIVRDGIEFDLIDPATTFRQPTATFGIPEVDRIVAQYTPCGKRGPKQRLMFADDPGGIRG